MRDPHEKIIGSHTYCVTPLPAGLGMKVLARIAKALGPAIGRVATVNDALGSAVGLGLSAAIETLDPADLDATCRDFAKYTTVSTASGGMVPLDKCFDLHFAGEYLELAEWLAFCGEVNFAPLLEGLKAKVGALGHGGSPVLHAVK